MPHLSPELLRTLLDYDPKTGALTWKSRTTGKRPLWWNRMYAGKRAGSTMPDGNVLLKIDDRSYLAHRVIWAMVHGAWPECVVHRNGKLGDNRLRNLRDVNRKTIQRQPVLYRTNTSGVRGVSWSKAARKWVASIRVDDLTIHLGSFATKEEAARARRAGEERRDRWGV